MSETKIEYDDSLEQNSQISDFVDWINPPTVLQLKSLFSSASIEHDRHIADVVRWTNNLKIEGSAKIKPVKGRSSITPKLIRKQAEWRYSSLSDPFLSTEDLFNVYPTTAGDKNRAEQNSLVLNNQFNTQIGKTAFIDNFVREFVNLGTVFVKVCWLSETEVIDVETPVYDFIPINPEDPAAQQLYQKYMMLLQMQQQNHERYMDYSTPGLDQALQILVQKNMIVEPVQVGTEVVEEVVETKNQPSVEIIDHKNIYIDPTCDGKLENAQFIFEQVKTSLSELRKTGLYKNLDRVVIDSADVIANPDYDESPDNYAFTFEDDVRKKFILTTYWGTWDINKTGIAEPIVASYVNDTLVRLGKNPYPDRKHPFVSAPYMPVARSVYGEPDGELIEDNQKIIGAITRGAIDLFGKSANAQTGFKRGVLDVPNKRKFKNNEDYEFQSNEDPRQAIIQHKFPEVPVSVYNMITMQANEAESLTGVKTYNSGISGQSLGPVASTGMRALDAASKRELGILRRAKECIIQVGKKIISMNAEFLSEEEIIRITDNQFINIRRDDLAGNFDLRLAISTAEEDAAKAQELAFMLQTIGPNQDPNITRIIQADIAKLRKMPELAKKILEYRPEPDPIEEAKKELEVLLLQAQIEKEMSLASKHGSTAGLDQIRAQKEATQARLNMAKSMTEQAKARFMSSQADKVDLDFIETESGVKQTRDLEKINEKQQNEMAIKIIDKSIDRQNKDTGN
jgi:hypothetical protein